MTRYCWVWWARTVPDPDRLLPVLDEHEQARYEAYADEDRRIRFGSGRLVAKSIIADMLGRRPTDITFTARCPRCGEPHGKPMLPADLPPLDLSISTTSERVVVAVMNGFRIGIDVLRVDESAEVEKLTKQTFHQIERNLWHELPAEERQEGYFRVLVRKNAVLKALGVLCDYELNEIMVSAADDEPGLVSNPDPDSRVDVHGAQMFDLDPGDGHIATLAVLNSGGVVVQEHTWEPLTPARRRLRLV